MIVNWLFKDKINDLIWFFDFDIPLVLMQKGEHFHAWNQCFTTKWGQNVKISWEKGVVFYSQNYDRYFCGGVRQIDSSCPPRSSRPAHHARWSGLWWLSYGGYSLVIGKLQFRYPGGRREVFLYIYPCLKLNIHWYDFSLLCVSQVCLQELFIFILLILITNGQKSASWHNCKCILYTPVSAWNTVNMK